LCGEFNYGKETYEKRRKKNENRIVINFEEDYSVIVEQFLN